MEVQKCCPIFTRLTFPLGGSGYETRSGVIDLVFIQLHNIHGYRPFHVGVASRLATGIYVAMVTPILYDNSYSLNDSNLKYEIFWPYG